MKLYEVKFWCYGEVHARYRKVKANSHTDAIRKAIKRENIDEHQAYNVESEFLSLKGKVES